MKKVTVVIGQNGNVKIEASGYTGPACKKATAELEKALGTVTGCSHTPDYHKAQVNRTVAVSQ